MSTGCGAAYISDGEAALFDVESPPPVSLADKFTVPPMSILDRRSGEWQDRRRRWMMLGLHSELGRSASAVSGVVGGTDPFSVKVRAEMTRVNALNEADSVPSIFDPVLGEIAYRWHTAAGDRVLDPFAGGSVRGIVAATLARWYTGIDLRDEQVRANRAQVALTGDVVPRWISGDSNDLDSLLGPDVEYDFLFSCPPYGDLEKYSDDPRDLSAMPHAAYTETHGRIISQAVRRLRRDRFAAWVVSDIRDPQGAYRGVVVDTIRAFRDAGAKLHNEAIILDPIASAALRAERPFRATRKLTRVHQHMLVFVKGDAKRAASRLNEAAA